MVPVSKGTVAIMAYELPWYENRARFPDLPELFAGFTAQDYTLAYALGVPDNYAAEMVVSTHLHEHHPDLATRVRFESEMGCFFAYTDTEGDMLSLVACVAGLVSRTHPSAHPGSILDSPAAIRRWEDLLEG